VKVLVTFALESEFAPWRKLRGFKRVSIAAWDRSYRAQVGSANVRVLITGVGRFAAQRSMARAFTDLPTDVCISSGLAGSLRSTYRLGEVLAARATCEASGEHIVYSHSELLADAVQLGATRVERLIVSEEVVGSADEKQSLGAFGDAIDMESLYVLAASAHNAIPAIAVRAISDGTESNLPLDFNRVFDDRGAVSVPKVIGQLLAHPQRVGGLLRIARQSQRAASALAAFLDAYVQEIGHDPLFEVSKADAIAV